MSSSFINPRISPLTIKYEYPQLSLLIITEFSNQQNRNKVLCYYSMLMYSQQNACFKHSNFFTVKDGHPLHDNLMPHRFHPRMVTQSNTKTQRHGGSACTTHPTTSFLTATTLIYAIGAGITAAAGTRLALQLILDKRFKLFSFQLPHL